MKPFDLDQPTISTHLEVLERAGFNDALHVAVALFGIALLACWLPPHRATKIDPTTAE